MTGTEFIRGPKAAYFRHFGAQYPSEGMIKNSGNVIPLK